MPILILALVALYAFGVGAPLYAQDGVPTVTSVTIRGQKRIELQAIEGRLTLKANDRFTADALREQVKILYGTGYFEDVQVETEPAAGGVSVGFVVREKPFITEIVFDGNEELSDDKLKEKVTIKSQTFLDQQQAKESAEKIRLAYQEDGYYNCQVIPVIQAVDEDRKRLTYFIKEGTKAKVLHINFEGMRAVTKEEIFKVTATREWIPWYGLITQLKVPSLLSDAGVLKREELGNDIERMREVYLNKGYLNVQISQPTLELSEDKKWFEINYSIVEGEPFIVHPLEVASILVDLHMDVASVVAGILHDILEDTPVPYDELRDDLRLIIDTAAAQQYGEHSLDELLAPLRHRTTRHLPGVEGRVHGVEAGQVEGAGEQQVRPGGHLGTQVGEPSHEVFNGGDRQGNSPLAVAPSGVRGVAQVS